jgi:hypothetical protein
VDGRVGGAYPKHGPLIESLGSIFSLWPMPTGPCGRIKFRATGSRCGLSTGRGPGLFQYRCASFAFGLLSAASALAISSSVSMSQTGSKAGVAAAVRGSVQQISFRTPQASVGRNVSSGQEVFLGDRIVTGPTGGLQILLLDGTTFSIGPNSDLAIDEFVFNPSNGSGNLSASITRGTLRLISGHLARQDREAIRIKLPTATVGVRGTMSIFSGGPAGWFTGLFGVGPENSADRPASHLLVEINGAKYEVFRTGWGCMIAPANPTCTPQPVGPEMLQQLLGQIGGQFRYVNIAEFERLSGLDVVTALGLMKTHAGFEDLWKIINNLFQDRFRPTEVQAPGAPTSPPPPSPPPLPPSPPPPPPPPSPPPPPPPPPFGCTDRSGRAQYAETDSVATDAGQESRKRRHPVKKAPKQNATGC